MIHKLKMNLLWLDKLQIWFICEFYKNPSIPHITFKYIQKINTHFRVLKHTHTHTHQGQYCTQRSTYIFLSIIYISCTIYIELKLAIDTGGGILVCAYILLRDITLTCLKKYSLTECKQHLFRYLVQNQTQQTFLHLSYLLYHCFYDAKLNYIRTF